jgi:hypothetical protein
MSSGKRLKDDKHALEYLFHILIITSFATATFLGLDAEPLKPPSDSPSRLFFRPT